MPLIAIGVGLTAGLAVWLVLDQIQSRQVGKIFGQELKAQLELRARESLVRFERYLASYSATTRLLANSQRLSEYLEPLLWSRDQTVEPLIYRDFRPHWLPDFFARDALLGPSHVLLIDPWGQVREIFQSSEARLPEALATEVPEAFYSERTSRALIERFDGRLYLIASDATSDAAGYAMGYLLVLVPIDEAFLAASQRGVDVGRTAVALVDGRDQELLVSIDAETLPSGTGLDRWRSTYVITSQPLLELEGSGSDVRFATFVSQAVVEKMSRHVRLFERRQRGIAALVFILVFTAVIYLVSMRLNKVLQRMTRFSTRALGFAEPGFARGGNQLVLLEEWIQHFTQLVLAAREEMSRRHQAEMRQSEALKAAMMEASLDAVVTLDQGGRVIEFNPAAERLLGLSREAALGQVFGEQCVPEAARGRLRHLLDHSQPAHRCAEGRAELVVRHVSGAEIPVELSIVPIDLESEPVHTLYIHDITERKRAEQEIQGLARFASESPSPILRVTAAGLLVYANSASRTLLIAWGCAPGEPLPAPWHERVMSVLASGKQHEEELEAGGQLYSLLFAPIADLGYVNIYARDITAVRRAEQEARQHQAELVHVCRLSTLGEVATGMAHELNQPLSAIVNYANGCIRRLQSGAGEPEALIGALNQVALQARRASDIIRHLRTLVGKQPPVCAQVDLNHLARQVCSFIEFDTHRLDLQITLELHPEAIPVLVDLVQLEQVVLNLLRNALDALEEVAPERRRLVLRTTVLKGEARLSVEDSGPGIPAERLATLFDPFVTTKEGGMGMGLAISQTIVENHEGRIWAESEPGRGSIFHIALPLAASAESLEAPS